MSESKLYTVGEFSKKAGVTIRTLRYYDKIGLLTPTTHNDIGHRLYNNSDFQKLQRIITLKFVGFSLSDIQNVMASPDTSIEETLKMQKKILLEKREHITMVINAINETSNMLKEDQHFEWEKFINIIQVINMEKDWINESGIALKHYNCIRIHDKFSTNLYGWRHWLFDQLGDMNGCNILDVGCGEAGLWVRNFHQLNANTKITLTDISDDMLKNAKDQLGDKASRFTFVLADIQELPFEDESFDKVIADHMIYYVHNYKRALSEIYRVLKPGGKIYVSATGQDHLQELPKLLSEFNEAIRLTGFTLKKFNLENGEKHLSKWFHDIELHKYQDALVITEEEPLLQYILSATGNMREILIGDMLQKFKLYLQNLIAEDEGLHVTKNTGLFIGCK
ncbi:MerR family transcriptional regulator [Vallitalea okinawensis]|uniref:MerR family transcriptional regulator n=1 Tax=Vallitalea okinawensis TaxID=2078660 RepID=UPI00147872E3|nr:MerR family transcriptional regulator [Vallitalea okinawensis]